MRHINLKARDKKAELDKKYDKKIEHLRRKYEVDKEKEMGRVPDEMEDYGGVSVFDDEQFRRIETAEIPAVKYGKVELDEEEEEAMKLHPKMELRKKLESGFMDVALDMSYTKVRWQLRKEEEQGVKEDESIEDRKKRRISEEEIDRRGQIQAGI